MLPTSTPADVTERKLTPWHNVSRSTTRSTSVTRTPESSVTSSPRGSAMRAGPAAAAPRAAALPAVRPPPRAAGTSRPSAGGHGPTATRSATGDASPPPSRRRTTRLTEPRSNAPRDEPAGSGGTPVGKSARKGHLGYLRCPFQVGRVQVLVISCVLLQVPRRDRRHRRGGPVPPS